MGDLATAHACTYTCPRQLRRYVGLRRGLYVVLFKQLAQPPASATLVQMQPGMSSARSGECTRAIWLMISLYKRCTFRFIARYLISVLLIPTLVHGRIHFYFYLNPEYAQKEAYFHSEPYVQCGICVPSLGRDQRPPSLSSDVTSVAYGLVPARCTSHVPHPTILVSCQNPTLPSP